MRTASMIGFWVMIGLGVAAIVWVDAWWARVILLVAAVGVGWYSLGLYSEAATAAARRTTRSLATPEDEDLLHGIGPRARDEAFRVAGGSEDATRSGGGDDV
jgi:hypothetical protein